MPFQVQSSTVKTMLFHSNTSIKYTIGEISSLTDQQVFRYTCSSRPIQGSYKATLQQIDDPNHVPYTFDIEADSLVIAPVNDDAINVWRLADTSRRDQLIAALNALCRFTIQS